MKQNEISKGINPIAKSKDTYWQAIRGICIIVVLYGHSRGGWNFEKWQYNDAVTSFNYQYWIIPTTIIVDMTPLTTFFFCVKYRLCGFAVESL